MGRVGIKNRSRGKDRGGKSRATTGGKKRVRGVRAARD